MWIGGVIYMWGLRGIWYPFFAAWCAVSAFISTRIFRRSLSMSQAEWQTLRYSGLGAELLRGWLSGWQTFMNMFVVAWVSAAMGKVCFYPPFTGPTAQAIVAKVMTAEPEPVSTYRKTVPAHVADAVTVALAKLPADRFPAAAAFAAALGTPSFALPATSPGAPSGVVSRWRTAFVAAALVAMALLVLTSFLLQRPAAGPVVTTYDVGLPDSAAVEVDAWGALSVSPDGRFVVYVARRGAGNELWYRSLVDSVSRPIAGTTAVVRPVVSPGGERVAFLTVSKLQVVPIGGGVATTLADVSFANLKWTPDDRIMLMNGDGTSLQWFDPSGQSRGASPTSYCFLPEPLGDGSQLLCGGGATKSAYIIRILHVVRT